MLTVGEATHGNISLLRQGVDVQFSFDEEKKDDLIARVVNSGARNWWIYHQFKYTGANKEVRVAKDVRINDDDSD